MKPVRNVGTGRWSGRFDLVSGNTIHHAASIFRKVDPTSSAAKFFRRIGQSDSSATMRPLRAASARPNRRPWVAVSAAAGQSQAGLDEPFRQDDAIKLVLWPLQHCQVLFDLREPTKVTARRDTFGGPAHLVDGP